MNKKSIPSKLQELFDLFKSGALSKDEFETLKSGILSNLDMQISETKDSHAKMLDKEESAIDKQFRDNAFKEELVKNQQKKKNIKHLIYSMAFLIFFVAILLIMLKVNQKHMVEAEVHDELVEVKNAISFWSKSEATELIMNELSGVSDWSSIEYHHGGYDELYHEVIDFTNIKLRGNELNVGIVFSNFKNNDGSYSRGVLSVFEFEDDGSWHISRKSIAFANGSSGGRIPVFLRVTNISIDNYGLIVENSSGTMGEIIQSKSLFAFVNDEFNEVLNVEHYYSIEETYTCTFSFIYGSTSFSDIKVSQHETSSNGYETTTETDYFFDGVEYVVK